MGILGIAVQPCPHLTPMERRVFALLAEAQSPAEIALALRRSRSTIGTHIANLHSKCDTCSVQQLTAVAIEHRACCALWPGDP